jgi:hypothetical protein
LIELARVKGSGAGM